jgi:hypothetical protein
MEEPLQHETIVFRTCNEIKSGYSSYTLLPNQYEGYGTEYKFKLPKGFKIVNTRGYADIDELIINLKNEDIINYKIQ